MPYERESLYRDERNKLIDGERDYSKSYDKYLLTLSGGALALSMTFVRDIIGDGPVDVPALIVLAWISFTISIAASLVSIQQSGPLFREFLGILDANAQHAGDKFSWTEVRTQQSKRWRLHLMDWLNYGSIVLFLVGVILLLCFAGGNLAGDISMTDESQSPETHIASHGRPALVPVDGNPTTVSPANDVGAGKPAPAPVDVAPPSPPSEEPAPSEPAQDDSSDAQD